MYEEMPTVNDKPLYMYICLFLKYICYMVFRKMIATCYPSYWAIVISDMKKENLYLAKPFLYKSNSNTFDSEICWESAILYLVS